MPTGNFSGSNWRPEELARRKAAGYPMDIRPSAAKKETGDYTKTWTYPTKTPTSASPIMRGAKY